jgi:predicted O-methyltransferase YrrM
MTATHDSRASLRLKGLELFAMRKWREAADKLSEGMNGAADDPQLIGALGICFSNLGEYENAENLFRKLRPPFHPFTAVNRAAHAVKRREYGKALEILSNTDRTLKARPDSEIQDVLACIILEMIVSVVVNDKNLKSLRPVKRDRLLKLTYLFMLPFFSSFDMLGQLFSKLGLANGTTVRKMIENFRQQCWVYGIQLKPDFIDAFLKLDHMEGYKKSNQVYRDTFHAYLDYWLGSGEDIRSLLLASQKPGDAHALYCLIREKRPSVILEIGTFVGFSTCIMAQAVRDNGIGTIYCIDPNLKHLSITYPLSHARTMLKKLDLDRHVQITEGFFSEPRGIDAHGIPVLGSQISEILPAIDLAFIDGDHSTPAVMQDFMMSLSRVKDKATVIFHDVRTWQTVRQGIFTIFQDASYRRSMRYFEFDPSGVDGLGFIEVSS